MRRGAGARAERREDLLRKLDRSIRRVSAQSVLISDATARHVGLNSTDLECLDLLGLDGPSTAGQLAARSGLTTGAMTAVLDRLEGARFVRRKRDRTDRRRVVVEVLPRAFEVIGPFYEPLAAATARLHEAYSDSDLALIVDYLSRAFDVSAQHVAWLGAQPAVAARRRPAARKTDR